MTNRTLSQSKQDLVDSAKNSGVFRKSLLESPAQIDGNDLPLMAIEPGADFQDFTGHDPREAEYTGDYEFDVVLAFKSDCPESEVVTGRNTFMQKVVADSNTNSYRPFKLTQLRHFKGDWQNYECWLVSMTFTRHTCEEFTTA